MTNRRFRENDNIIKKLNRKYHILFNSRFKKEKPDTYLNSIKKAIKKMHDAYDDFAKNHDMSDIGEVTEQKLRDRDRKNGKAVLGKTAEMMFCKAESTENLDYSHIIPVGNGAEILEKLGMSDEILKVGCGLVGCFVSKEIHPLMELANKKPPIFSIDYKGCIVYAPEPDDEKDKLVYDIKTSLLIREDIKNGHLFPRKWNIDDEQCFFWNVHFIESMRRWYNVSYETLKEMVDESKNNRQKKRSIFAYFC